MAATGAGRDNDGAKRLASDFLGQRFGDLEREFIFVGQCTKCARHAATSGVQKRNFALGHSPSQASQKPGMEVGFEVTMSMDDDARGSWLEQKCIRLVVHQLVEELLEKK